LKDLGPLGLVFRTDLGLVAYERRWSQRSSIHWRLSTLELNSFSLCNYIWFVSIKFHYIFNFVFYL